MDSGSEAERPVDDPRGAVDRLAAAADTKFAHLEDARRKTQTELERVADELGALEDPSRHCLTMFGSWAREELTDGSDNDWAVVTRDAHPHSQTASNDVARCHEVLSKDGKEPGSQDIFGCAFAAEQLMRFIGLDTDTNTNLTRRMLLLTESTGVLDDSQREYREFILDAYLDLNPKGRRPPRFLLNDLVRYWRTMCVDFEGKHRGSLAPPKKWVTRNAKLRTSRKLLFVSALTPVLLCAAIDEEEIRPYLASQFSAPATDRIAAAFEYTGMVEPGARTLRAYDSWVGLMARSANRDELMSLDKDSREGSALFEKIRQIGLALDRGFQALLFESALEETTRKYAVL